MNDPRIAISATLAEGGVGEAVPHESAALHVSGSALYTDDILEARGTLYGAPGLSARAHARVRSMDLSEVRAAPGVVAVLGAEDIPGENNCGAVLADDPVLAAGEVRYVGQPLFLVIAQSSIAARRAARAARIEYEDLPATLTVDEALERQSWVLPAMTLQRGEADKALAEAPLRLQGTLRLGGQEHFYLEGQVAYALPGEQRGMRIYSSTQHPGEVQQKVARMLAVDSHSVTVECRRMGGGFGGKETQATQFACLAALAAWRLDRPVKLRLDRDDDFTITGKRHDFLIRYDVGFQADGRVLGLHLTLASRCGHSADLSGAVNNRALTHTDNCYFFENVRVESLRCRTHTQSATAFRGFGGPQGMMAAEIVMDEVARHLRLDPALVRRRNFYVPGSRDRTHYGMKVGDFIADKLFDELERSAEYPARREAIRRWNRASPVLKRGIAMTPVKFGIAYTAKFFNQASALVHIYTDGSVLLNHGGTEMGQGLFTKVAQVVATELGIDLKYVRASGADTSKIPNASATSASSGSDLNGKAAQAAARELKARLAAVAAERFHVPPEAVRFEANRVHAGSESLSFRELVKMAYLARVQLWASGFYRTPKIDFDPKTLTGRPFFYFCYGAAVSEVAIDTLTGENRVLRVDILHDVGRSLNPAIDIGQIEGGFVQGMGWLTSEELVWDGAGRLRTHAPSTYKIPVASDVPPEFRVRLYERGENVEDTIHRSKAIGEPPLMLAMSVFFALRDAIASVGDYQHPVRLDAPATPERILAAVEDVRERAERART
ncbi:MAG TPA: xanthine dehydrogenase molybdopterin binding subunit [Burkholderiales bacterium]